MNDGRKIGHEGFNRWILLGMLLALLALALPARAQQTPPPEGAALTDAKDRQTPPGGGDGTQAAPDQPAEEAHDADAAKEAPAAGRVLGEQTAIFTSLTILPGERVRGDLVCVGCTLDLGGEVSGDVVLVGASATLRADVGGLVAVASSIDQPVPVSVRGDFVAVVSDIDGAGISVGGERVVIPSPFPLAGSGVPFGALTSLLGWLKLTWLLLVLVGLLLLTAIAPARVRTLGDQLGPSLGLALLTGFLAHAGVVLIYILLGLSVVGAPLIPLVALAFIIARMFGRAAVLQAVGRQLGRGLNREMSVIGALLLGFLPYAALKVAPFFFGLPGVIVGAMLSLVIWVFVDWPALGIVLLTRFGARERQPRISPPSPPPSPPDSPAGLAGTQDA